MFPLALVTDRVPAFGTDVYNQPGGIKLSTDILIDASLERVWGILTDFPYYTDWNPFMQVSGGLGVNQPLSVSVTVDGKRTSFQPLVKVIAPPQRFAWQGRLLLPGIFDGYHEFLLEEVSPGQVRFTQREVFRGLLSGIIMKSIQRGTLEGYQAMNQALKERSERNIFAGCC